MLFRRGRSCLKGAPFVGFLCFASISWRSLYSKSCRRQIRRCPARLGERLCLLCGVLRQPLAVLAAWRVTGRTGLSPTQLVLSAVPPLWRSEAVLIAVRRRVAHTRHGKENEGSYQYAHHLIPQ